jgi:hypothetical protein
MNLFSLISQKYNEWKENRFLKKHGVSTREEYEYRYDKDCNNRATILSEIYNGYNIIIAIPNPTLIDDICGLTVDSRLIKSWTKENCINKVRVDVFPVYVDDNGNLIYGGNLGMDEIIVCFKDSDDATNFLMTYNGPELSQHNKQTIIINNTGKNYENKR